ncbi:unnamed protein product [Rotaria sp. Silwood2]|nr:unnamed protein product [Rotaria sp. Silwood2]CAF4289221.1 unnamed protein product [Rotaria sp. Silwood2]
MASVTAKQPCIKCDKGGGVATCGGCQQWFCVKHFNGHRQELATGMDMLGEEHDLLQRDLIQDIAAHGFLSCVNDWEQKSVTKIQAAAEQARIDIQIYLDQNKQQLKTSLDQMTNELKLGRQSDDYTEIDLKKWMEQMKLIREMLEKPSTIRIIDDDDADSIIHLIQNDVQRKVQDLTEQLSAGAEEYKTWFKKYIALEHIMEMNYRQEKSRIKSLISESVLDEEAIESILRTTYEHRQAKKEDQNDHDNENTSLQRSLNDTDGEMRLCPMCFWNFPQHLTFDQKKEHIEHHFA